MCVHARNGVNVSVVCSLVWQHYANDENNLGGLKQTTDSADGNHEFTVLQYTNLPRVPTENINFTELGFTGPGQF